MLPDRVSNPGPLTYESGALPIALRGPALCRANETNYLCWCQTKRRQNTFPIPFTVPRLFHGRDLVELGWFWFNRPLRQYSSLYRAVSQRGRKKREKIDECKNVQTTPTRTYCKRSRPLPYYPK